MLNFRYDIHWLNAKGESIRFAKIGDTVSVCLHYSISLPKSSNSTQQKGVPFVELPVGSAEHILYARALLHRIGRTGRTSGSGGRSITENTATQNCGKMIL